ncbi:hypothetical protein VFPPC_15520 [Pochonia chlamydosporia 170]|uniref:Uncharacterized protein n=1 Tax=Pochonia chlamydosporia 170 TaxID=1380566 RepID=A0A179FWH1_METCM|nr:hypothetical protein VFPPC_15520 [Pochonia chlamydosporia 170]OAQ70005.1 hypothetical protein VFPPC_15520 [Pochonia chlamydosporia 170]
MANLAWPFGNEYTSCVQLNAYAFLLCNRSVSANRSRELVILQLVNAVPEYEETNVLHLKCSLQCPEFGHSAQMMLTKRDPTVQSMPACERGMVSLWSTRSEEPRSHTTDTNHLGLTSFQFMLTPLTKYCQNHLNTKASLVLALLPRLCAVTETCDGIHVGFAANGAGLEYLELSNFRNVTPRLRYAWESTSACCCLCEDLSGRLMDTMISIFGDSI